MKRTKPSSSVARTKTGPKREFSPETLRTVEFLTKLGATDKQIAEYFNVGVGTVEVWNRKYPDYIAARKRGGPEASMRVVESLFQRAVGMKYVEEEFTAIEINGKPVPMEKMRRVRRTTKWLPPDVKAAIHWLRIKERDTWGLAQEMLHKHSGNVNHLHRKIEDIPVHELSEQTKQMVFEVAQKTLALDNRGN